MGFWILCFGKMNWIWQMILSQHTIAKLFTGCFLFTPIILILISLPILKIVPYGVMRSFHKMHNCWQKKMCCASVCKVRSISNECKITRCVNSLSVTLWSSPNNWKLYKVKIDVKEGLKRFMRAIENDTDPVQHLMAIDDNGCSIVHLLAAHGFEEKLWNGSSV